MSALKLFNEIPHAIDVDQVRADTSGINQSTHLLACGSALMPKSVVDAVVSHTQLEAQISGYEAQVRQSDLLEKWHVFRYPTVRHVLSSFGWLNFRESGECDLLVHDR